MTPPIKVFISYGREDRATAQQLYRDLQQQAGVTPWIDCERLLPGQKWRQIINRALQDSKYVVTLLSSRTLSRRGYVQKEIRKALEVVEELPAEDVFVIPVRLDECRPQDERLQELHWVDLFPDYEAGLQQILRVLLRETDAPTPAAEADPTPAAPPCDPDAERRDLDEAYDLLSEKIAHLRKARIIETDAAVLFKLDKQLEAAVRDREQIEADLKRLLQPELIPGLSATDAQVSEFSFEVVTVNRRGEIVERRPGRARQLREDLGNGLFLEMVAIPGGTFLMGSPETEPKRHKDEGPQHQVTVAPFLMGRYPVTQAQWQAVMGNNPSYFKGPQRPVEQVSWNDAMEFCQKLSERTGRPFRLPSEAEWEYAGRAGTTTPFCFGPTITTELANYAGTAKKYADEPKGVYREQTTDAGQFPPNAFGLYDVHGNVWEWCADSWYGNYEDAPDDGSPRGKKDDQKTKVLRGGSWYLTAGLCRAACRLGLVPDLRFNDRGFRVVLSASARTLE
jgi:formylglycine-generating enzyme required for sulfatase activity